MVHPMIRRHPMVRRHRGRSARAQSEIYRRCNVENDWNSSVVRRSPSKAIIGFPIISDYFQCRKYRFPDVGHRRKYQGFCALESSEFRLKHALRNSLSMYVHELTNIGTINGLTLVFHHFWARTYIYTFWDVIGRYWPLVGRCRHNI